jgi:hypothetical protein
MNCVRCNTPLEANVRFCRHCGLPVSNPSSQSDANANGGKAAPSPLYQPVSGNTDAPTIPPTSWQAPPNAPRQQQPLYLAGQSDRPATPVPPAQQAQQGQQWQQWQQQGQQAWRPTPAQSSPFTQPARRDDIGTMRSSSASQARQAQQSPQPRPRKRRGRRLLITLLVIVVVLLALVIGGRFALNALAINQINQALSDAINNVPSQVALLPERDQTITDGMANALITQQSSSASPVQNLTIHFTPNNVEIDFNVFSFSSTITTVPKIVNGQLVATNVTVQGIAGLILSPDDITNVMNTQIRNLETHIQHTITAVTLENHAILLHIKPGGSSPTQPTKFPTSVPTSIPTNIPTAIPTNIPLP